MKIFKYTYNIIAILTLFALFACTEKDNIFAEGGESVTVTFYPTLAEEANTRAIGDATGIDRLTVAVYEGTETLSKIFSLTEDWAIAQINGVSLTLIEGRTYNILFWAENSTNTAYELTDDGNITVNYDDYKNGGFDKMEQMDAFCRTSSVTVGAQKEESKQIELSRPLAQFNFADKATPPVTGTHKAVVTFANLPAEYNPFTGEITSTTNATFTFTDFPTEKLKINNIDYYYLSSNYFFAPGAINATLDFQTVDDTGIKQVELRDIALEKNKKTNVLGTIVQQPSAWSVWDGSTKTEPAVDAQNRYIIDEASDLAWLYDNADTLSQATFVVTTDIDMSKLPGQKSIQMPAGSTIEGGEHTVKGLTTALLSEATNLTIKDLTIDDSQISSTATHVGLLANIVKGSETIITNVTIQNSSATTTNGAAGGFVGYIVRTSEKDRNETLNVSFNGCKLNNVQVSASASEGKFVGLLSGYDNNENLTFEAGCDAANVTVADYTSVYTKANNSAWVTSDVTDKYDGWLGHETYRRAKVTFAGVRLAPKWDGSTKITPITEDGTKLIYSPFDLANLQGSAHTAVTFKEDVDLGGDRTSNKNPFKPISKISTLEGDGKTIYNLYVNVTDWIGGFIGSSSGTTSHKNINFKNSSITVTPSDGSEYAYTSTLCAYIEGAYTTSNVHVESSYVKGVGKVGGLIGFITGGCTNATIDNCSVENSKIENIYLKLENETFPASGEIGGLIGFITASSSSSIVEVKNSWVTSNSFNCCTYKATMWDRSVNPFIGDIATMKGETIKISNCEIKGTNVYTNCENGNSETFDTYSGYLSRKNFLGGYSNTGSKLTSNLMGQCYCVYIPIIFTSWTMGKVYVDGKQIFGLK